MDFEWFAILKNIYIYIGNGIEVRDSKQIVKCMIDVQVNVHAMSCLFMDLAI